MAEAPARSSSEARQFWVQTVDDDGYPFWYHTQTHRATRSDPRAPASNDWAPAVDPATGRTYYCNTRTGVTSWTVPESGVPVTSSSTSADAAASTRAAEVGAKVVGSGQYAQHATFNRGSGRFGGTGAADDHWSRKGIADDKSGRQMQAYFDVSQLEANRVAAARKKQQRLATESTDWKALKRDRKEKRRQDQKRALIQE